MADTKTVPVEDIRCLSGIHGLDDILAGGLPRNCFYLIQGDPGSGKPPWRCSSCWKDYDREKKLFYITLSETKAELLHVARSHGWSLMKFPYFRDVRHRDFTAA